VLLTMARGLETSSTALVPAKADIKRASSSAKQDDAIVADNGMDNEDNNKKNVYVMELSSTQKKKSSL
jgi:hypothetical protein